MKVAFLILNQRDQIRRCEAYIRNNLDLEYDLVFVQEDWEKEQNLPFAPCHTIDLPNVSYIPETEYKNENYCLVLINSDKTMPFLIEHMYPGMVNINDKVVAQSLINDFGKFDFIRSNLTDEFDDEDWVFVKPRISSGGFSTNPLCYNKRQYKEVKHFANDGRHLIQESVDTYDILLLSFVNNGKDLVLFEIVEQEFRPSSIGNVFTSYLQSNLALRDEYADLIATTKEFFHFIGYTNYKGFFGVQFLRKDGKLIPIDFNLRNGPVAMELEFRKLMDTRMYKAIPFFFGNENSKEYLENPRNYERYRCYAEIDGKPVTDFKFTPNYEGRVKISSGKTSGTFREDYDMYVEKIID